MNTILPSFLDGTTGGMYHQKMVGLVVGFYTTKSTTDLPLVTGKDEKSSIFHEHKVGGNN